jgi:plastocyanin domain-containing protein
MRTWIMAAALVCSAACSKQDSTAKQPEKPAAAPATPSAGNRVEIKVKKAGYEPDKVQLAAGQEVTLVFTRVEDTECGSEVQIPSIGVKKELPLNQPVEIAFKADKPGEVGFACGMDMMRGSLVVQ